MGVKRTLDDLAFLLGAVIACLVLAPVILIICFTRWVEKGEDA